MSGEQWEVFWIHNGDTYTEETWLDVNVIMYSYSL